MPRFVSLSAAAPSNVPVYCSVFHNWYCDPILQWMSLYASSEWNVTPLIRQESIFFFASLFSSCLGFNGLLALLTWNYCMLALPRHKRGSKGNNIFVGKQIIWHYLKNIFLIVALVGFERPIRLEVDKNDFASPTSMHTVFFHMVRLGWVLLWIFSQKNIFPVEYLQAALLEEKVDWKWISQKLIRMML